MSKYRHYIAVDLGSSNGRLILGKFDGTVIKLEVLHRFENNYIRFKDACYWDVLYLYSNIIKGLSIYSKQYNKPPDGIGVDTWGVDFGLIDKRGRLIGYPQAYRDPRGLEGMHKFHKKFGKKAAFNITGNANYEYNTLYQLYSMVEYQDAQLEIADKLLLMPDLLAYMLCGKASCEYTHASTTQMLSGNDWSDEILGMLGIRRSLLPDIQFSGEKKGNLLPHVLESSGLFGTIPVYCVGSHDTASAAASVPAAKNNYVFLSSETRSMIGMESNRLIINGVVFDHALTNEGTVTGGYRLQSNIMGLWIIQECKREWDREMTISWNEIVDQANAAPIFMSFIDVNDRIFFDSGNMVKKIRQYCASTGQEIPTTIGEVARTVYESLAMSYREAFIRLEMLRGTCIDVLHIVGGGSNNKLLNQMTANAINRDVVAGPVEATAVGNLMVQVQASGGVKDLAGIRAIIRNSFEIEVFHPNEAENWTRSFNRYQTMTNMKTPTRAV